MRRWRRAKRNFERSVGDGSVAKMQVADPVERVGSRERDLDACPRVRIAVLHRENGGEQLHRPADGRQYGSGEAERERKERGKGGRERERKVGERERERGKEGNGGREGGGNGEKMRTPRSSLRGQGWEGTVSLGFECEEGEHPAVPQNLDSPWPSPSSNSDRERRISAVTKRHVACPERRSRKRWLNLDP